MDFRILGPLEVVQDGRPLPLGAAKQRALLAILLLHANEAVSVDRLIDLLWAEEAPGTAPNTLQVYVSGLRKVLEPSRSRGAPGSLLVRRPPGYALQIDREHLDSLRFERLVDQATRLPVEETEERAARLRAALALWRGPALADFRYEPFAQAEAGRLEELRMQALEARIEADLALGRHAALVGELEALTALDPLRERLRAHLMLALYRSGRQAEALAVYTETRRILDEELGIDPSTSLQRLEQQILRQDTALDLARAPVEPASVARPETQRPAARKVVSVVCCAVEAGHLDPEAGGAVVERLHEVALATLERHGGSAQPMPGDEVVGVFGIPSMHEDDALRAARAAKELVEALPALRRDLGDLGGAQVTVACGVATGEVLAASSTLPRGGVLKEAADLARVASSGEVLVSAETRRHLGSAAETQPAPGAAAVFVLAGPVRDVRDGGRRLNAPLVGRRAELGALTGAYDRAVAERSPHLVTLLGVAGVGKSRLLAEFVRGLAGRAEVLSTRCPPYGEGVTFLPASDLVSQAARLGPELERDEALARIGSVLGEQRDAAALQARLAEITGFSDDVDGSVEELSWALRKLLESLARRRPVVVVLDDVHWAEPALLDTVDHVVEWARNVPMLLVCSARPEFLESRPGWASGKPDATSVVLEPLNDDECFSLLENLFGHQEAPGDIKNRIVGAAEGNPLFVEEMVRMLVDDGHLRCEGDRWIVVSDVSEVSIPPTIHALVAARLDRLHPAERSVLQLAALVGRDFSRDLVEHLCDEEMRETLDVHLKELVGKELIRPSYADEGEERYRFRHIVIRDTAYSQMPKQRRAELHANLADRLASQGVPRELVAMHLERAFHLRKELRAPAGEVAALGERAAELLKTAAQAASERGDLQGAAGLLERAIELVDGRGAMRAGLVLDLSDALAELGELARAEALLRELLERPVAELLAARARIQLWEIRSSSENVKGWREQATGDVREAMALFERAGDSLGAAKALNLKALIDEYDYRFGESCDALEVALEHARKARAYREETKIFYAYVRASLFGPVHVDLALARYRQFRERFPDNRLVEANCLRGMALLEAMKGRFDEAHSLLERYQELLGDLGLGLGASKALAPGMVQLLAGELDAAEGTFRGSYEELGRLGERNTRAITAAYLARVLYEQRRYDEALRFTGESEELAPEDDFTTMIEWASVRAKVLARRGALGEADRMSTRVVTLASRTDDLEARATTLLDRAEVLRLSGRAEESVPCIRDALVLYARKGDEVSAARARALLDEAGAPLVIDLREEQAAHR